jgi:hypothetical protein
MLVLALWPGVLRAQRPLPAASTPPGDGLWYSVTIGRGFARLDCDICRGGRAPALTGSLRVGGRLHQRVLVGAEGSGWLRSENQIDERIWMLSGIAQVYLPRAPKAHVKVGVAAMSYRIEDAQEVLSSTSLGLQAGLGYDVPVASRYYLTPSLLLSHGILGGRLKFNGAELPNRAHLTLLQLGVGVTRR